MTVEQLEKELEMMEIPQELYSIMVGGLPNEKNYALQRKINGKYIIASVVAKSGLKLFETESEACEFLRKMKKICKEINLIMYSHKDNRNRN